MTGPLGDMGSLLKQAQQLQRELDRVREELKAARVSGSAGGGAVRVELSGDRRALAVHVDPNVLKRSDAHAVEDLVLAALRDGLAKVDKLAETHMLRVTGGMPLPGLFL